MKEEKTPDPVALEQGKRLMKLFTKLNETQTEFCRNLGFTDGGTVTHVKKGERQISETLVYKIERFYPNVNTNWLLTGNGTMFNSVTEHVIDEPDETYRIDNSKYNDLLSRYNNLMEDFVLLSKKYTQLLEEKKK